MEVKREEFDELFGQVSALKALCINLRDLIEGRLSSNNLHANAVQTPNIKNGAIIADHIQALAIDATKIAIGTITSDQIKEGTIAADRLKVGDITALQISTGTITAGLLKTGGQAFSHNMVFSSTDADTVAWTAGTLKTADGTSYSIVAGNTGNMTARTYIYLDKGVSETVLQTSTSYDAPLGDERIPIATAEDGTGNAIFQVFAGGGGVFISGGMIAAHTITATQLWASYIVVAGAAADINAGATTVNGGQITDDSLVLSGAGGAATDFDWSHLYDDGNKPANDADVTNSNPQAYSWITGTKPPTDADHTADIVSAMAYEDLVGLAKLDSTVIVGGYIKTSLLTADNIKAGIIDGIYFKVGGSGYPDIYFKDSGIHLSDMGGQVIGMNKSGYKYLRGVISSTYAQVATDGLLSLKGNTVEIVSAAKFFRFYTTGTFRLPRLASAPTAHDGDCALKTTTPVSSLHIYTSLLSNWYHSTNTSSGW